MNRQLRVTRFVPTASMQVRKPSTELFSNVERSIGPSACPTSLVRSSRPAALLTIESERLPRFEEIKSAENSPSRAAAPGNVTRQSARSSERPLIRQKQGRERTRHNACQFEDTNTTEGTTHGH